MAKVAKLRKPPKSLTKAAALKAYNKLPVTEEPCEFLKGYGNWGLDEREYKKATKLAKIICRRKGR